MATRAEQLARQTAGVQSVENALQVAGLAPQPAQVPGAALAASR
jgi:hypothetical protein